MNLFLFLLTNMINFELLAEPFAASEISWRVAREVKGGAAVQVLAYIENRAVMDRLDSVCEPQNWRNEYAKGPDGGILCGLSIRIDNEWVTKWDGADNSDIEAVKGGLSDAMKRSGVQWGIGRYLYNLPAMFVELKDKGKNYHKCSKDNTVYGVGKTKYWDDPILPAMFLPKDHVTQKLLPDYIAQINSITSESLYKKVSGDIKNNWSAIPPELKETLQQLLITKKEILGIS